MTLCLPKPPTTLLTKPCGSSDVMHVRLGGLEFIPCLSGALYVPEYDTLLIADLHLEKGSSRAHLGQLLPPYDTRAGLLSLQAAIAWWTPARVMLLGDSFHDAHGPDRMAQADRALLEKLATETEFIWLSGNHDPSLPAHLPGTRSVEIALGDITLRHEPGAGAVNEIAGHLHPVAAIRRRGRRVRTKCFVISPARIILPAFGAYTGGLDVRHEAFRPLLAGEAFRVIMIGKTALHALPGRAVL
ncbi:MAG: ligase-associated DNA damage response endonuclease PdeM [Anderseniella sp.]